MKADGSSRKLGLLSEILILILRLIINVQREIILHRRLLDRIKTSSKEGSIYALVTGVAPFYSFERCQLVVETSKEVKIANPLCGSSKIRHSLQRQFFRFVFGRMSSFHHSYLYLRPIYAKNSF